MATFKDYDIGDNYSVVFDLGTLLPSDHLCKQIENIVNDLDTSAIERHYSNVGQNALHPKLMLCIIFYGYAQGIRSGRKLAKACEESIPFIYLSKGYFPKKSAINDFRKDHYIHFSALFLQVLEKCRNAGLADPRLSIIDGTKLSSNSAKRRTKTIEQFERWQANLEQDIASIESGLKKQPLQDNSQIKKNSNRKSVL